MESRLRMFLLMISGLLLICVVWESIIILLISQIFYENKITIKIQLFMSLRKQHRKKLQPIIGLIQSCLSQSSKEINNQMQINEGIVEQLLQIDIIKQTNSIPALKLLIYQLVFVLSQQQVVGKSEEKSENSDKISKMAQILFSIKQILKELNLDMEDSTLKNIQKRNGKDSPPTQRFGRNKHRIFLAYYNQFCSALQSMQTKGKTISKKSIEKQKSDDLLIGQLEGIILKKQQMIINLEREAQSYRQKISQLQYQLLEIKTENKELFQHRLFLEDERDQLQSELLEVMKKTSRVDFIDEMFEQKNIANKPYIQENSCSVYSQIQKHQFNVPPDDDIYFCLLSQSLTIQALVQ